MPPTMRKFKGMWLLSLTQISWYASYDVVGITADVGHSRHYLSDRLCRLYGSYGSVPEAYYAGISTVLSVSPVLCDHRALSI
jgi:hypothetical protein